jgi:hypothetical protein
MDLQSQFRAIQKELSALKGQSFQEHGIPLLNTGEGIGNLCKAALPLLAEHRDKIESVWKYMKDNFARWDEVLRREILESAREGKVLKGKNATDAEVFALIDGNIAEGKRALELCQHTPDAVVGIAKFFSKKARTSEQKLRDTQQKAPDILGSIVKLFADDPNIHKEPAVRDALAILKALAPKGR